MKRLFATLIILIFVFSSISAIAAHEPTNPDDVDRFMTYSEYKFMFEDYYSSKRPYFPEWEIQCAYEDWCRHHDYDPVW